MLGAQTGTARPGMRVSTAACTAAAAPSFPCISSHTCGCVEDQGSRAGPWAANCQPHPFPGRIRGHKQRRPKSPASPAYVYGNFGATP